MRFHAEYFLFDSQSDREFTFSYAILIKVNLITRKLNFCDANSSNLLQLTQLIDFANLLFCELIAILRTGRGPSIDDSSIAGSAGWAGDYILLTDLD